MIVGVHQEADGQIRPILTQYEDILAHNGMESRRVSCGADDFWDQLAELDAFIFPWNHHSWSKQAGQAITEHAEQVLGLRVYPNWTTLSTFDDKVKQSYYFQPDVSSPRCLSILPVTDLEAIDACVSKWCSPLNL